MMDFSQIIGGGTPGMMPETQQDNSPMGQVPSGNFAQMLQGGMPQIPPQSMQPQSAGPSPESVNRPAADPQTGPGILDGARNWLQSNPKMAQMIMSALGTVAGTGSIGKGAQAAALSGFDYDNQQYTRSQKEQENAQKHEETQQRLSADQRRLDQGDRTNDINARNVDSTIDYRTAQTEKLGTETKDLANSSDVRLKALQKKLDLIDVQIKHAGTQEEKDRLLLEKQRIENQRDQKYGDRKAEASVRATEAGIDSTVANTTATRVGTTGKMLDNDQKAQVNDFLSNLPSDEFKRHALGAKPKSDKPLNEQFQDFYVKMTTATGEPVDMDTAWKQFSQIQEVGKPGATSPADKEKTAWTSARDSVAPGKMYKGPDGKMYRREK